MISETVSIHLIQSAGPDGRTCGHAKAPLFVLKRHDRDRGAPGLLCCAGHFKCGDHTQGTIKPAAFGLAVGMRPQQDRRPLGKSEEVTHGVDLNGQPRIAHPPGKPFPRLNIGGGIGRAHHALAHTRRANGTQVVQVFQKSGGINLHL